MAKAAPTAKVNPHALGNEAPDDLDGRLVATEQRAKMIGDSLQAIARSELTRPDPETLYVFGQIALELSAELAAINEAYIAESNAAYDERTRKKGKVTPFTPEIAKH